MKRFLTIGLAIFAILAPSGAIGGEKPVTFTPGQLTWTAGTGTDKGSWGAALIGDSDKAGPYAMRIKFSPGLTYPPHTESSTEHITVISGTLYLGLGKKISEGAMHAFPAGSYISMPAGVVHYAMAKKETIIQVEGIGPDRTDFIK